jgi:hypothetical protein
MRAAFLILPLAAVAAPAAAQTAPPPPAAVPETIQIPPELSDPRWADRLTDAMAAMSKAFLNLPVGEVEAAMEGRRPTSADRRRTVQSETGMNERELERTIEQSKPMMQASQRAVVAALPAMMKGLSEAQREIERAMANVPRPDYPRR